MSEIDITRHIPFETDKSTPRVARTSTTSDDSSAQQKSPDKNTSPPKNTAKTVKTPAVHDTAVTISTTLSRLEVGRLITAKFLGIDGQNQPLIESKTGTYTVKYAREYQSAITKIPQGATLEVRILTIGRKIEARLILNKPAGIKTGTAPLSLAVTLELTSLGDGPPRLRAAAGMGEGSPEQQKLSYQATDLYQAENIARASISKLEQLPPPTTNPNYALYEKAVPQKNHQTIIPAAITGNALIAQEQATAPGIITGDEKTAARSAAHAIQNKINSVKMNVSQLLNKDTLATVIKTFPAPSPNLPGIIRQYLGTSGIANMLTKLETGQNFILKIGSIVLPDNRSGGINSAPPTISAAKGAPTVTSVTSPRMASANGTSPGVAGANGTSPRMASAHVISASVASAAGQQQPQKPPAPRQHAASPHLAPGEFSGIIVAPGKNSPQKIPGDPRATTVNIQKINGGYANHYATTSLARPGRDNSFIPLYLATPVSVIKFLSPVELKAGTVINFSLSNSAKPAARGKSASALSPAENITQHQTRPATDSSPAKSNPTGQIISDSIIPGSGISSPVISSPVIFGNPPITAPLDIPPQPLETLSQNWQSLSAILSVISTSSTMAQSLSGRLPGTENPARMTSGIIFFLAALGAKNPARVWLGPDIARQLERAGQKKLLKMLDHDMQRIFKLATTTSAADWRPALLPLQLGSTVNAIPILTRQLHDDNPDGGRNANDDDNHENIAATRFIVELDLSQFGQLQLDGLLKQQKLNIIIRSDIKLPPEMKNKMTGIFTNSLESIGFSGDLLFKNTSQPEISVKTILNQRIHLRGI